MTNLEPTVWRLKRALLEAVMKIHGFEGDASTGWSSVVDSNHRVTPPDFRGEGGGVETGVRPGIEPFFEELFPRVDQEVDRLVAPWLDTPDVEAMVPFARRLDDVVALTDVRGRGGRGSWIGPSVVASNLNLIAQQIDDDDPTKLGGATIRTFDEGFVAQIGPVAGNVCQVAQVLGATLEMEIQLWRRALEDVQATMDRAIEVLEVIIEGGAESWTGEINSASLALGALSLIASGPVGWTIGAASLGLAVLSTLGVGGAPPVAGGASHRDVMAGLAETLTFLNERTADQERELENNLADALRAIGASPDKIDVVTPRAFLSNTSASDILGGHRRSLAVDAESVRDVTDIFLDQIARKVRRAANLAEDSSVGYLPWSRSPELGLGPFGPAETWRQLHHYVEPALRNLAWEVDQASRHLAHAVNELHVLDDEIGGSLAHDARSIRDSGWDPTASPEPRPTRRPTHGGVQDVTV